jgi:hypothetical protein
LGPAREIEEAMEKNRPHAENEPIVARQDVRAAQEKRRV